MNTHKLAALLISSSFLIACSSSDTTESGGQQEPTELLSFDVSGPNDDSEEIAIINPAISEGNFTIEWSVAEPTESHSVTLYFSLNSTLSEADIEVYGENCITNTQDCAVQETYTTDCFFNFDNQIVCSDDVISTDLTSELATLPLNAYLIAEACDFATNDCDAPIAHEIELR